MSDHAEECNCIECRFGIVQVVAGVTGNEGKDEAQRSELVQRDTEGINISDASGDGHLDRKAPGLVASPAVVTPEQAATEWMFFHDQIAKAFSKFAASMVAELQQKLDDHFLVYLETCKKVSELEAQLQQARSKLAILESFDETDEGWVY